MVQPPAMEVAAWTWPSVIWRTAAPEGQGSVMIVEMEIVVGGSWAAAAWGGAVPCGAAAGTAGALPVGVAEGAPGAAGLPGTTGPAVGAGELAAGAGEPTIGTAAGAPCTAGLPGMIGAEPAGTAGELGVEAGVGTRVMVDGTAVTMAGWAGTCWAQIPA